MTTTRIQKHVINVNLAPRALTVQPAARAGDTLRVIMEKGKFQGVMAATTPTGCRRFGGGGGGWEGGGWG